MLSNPIWDMLFGEVEVKSTIKQRKLVKTVTSLPGWCSELCIQVRGYDRKIGQLENVTSFFFFGPGSWYLISTLLQSPFLSYTQFLTQVNVDLTAYAFIVFCLRPTEHSLSHLNTKLSVTAPLRDLPVGPRCASK